MATSIIGARPAKVGTSDRRCAEARLYRKTRAQLIEHVGGRPSATQSILIDRAATLAVQIARQDHRARGAGEMGETATRTYLAWVGSLSRLMRALGLDAAPRSPTRSPTPRQLMGLDPMPTELMQ